MMNHLKKKTLMIQGATEFPTLRKQQKQGGRMERDLNVIGRNQINTNQVSKGNPVYIHDEHHIEPSRLQERL